MAGRSTRRWLRTPTRRRPPAEDAGVEGAEPATVAPTAPKPSGATALKARALGLMRGMRRPKKDVETPVYDGPLAGDEAFVSAVATAPGASAVGDDPTLIDALFDTDAHLADGVWSS